MNSFMFFARRLALGLILAIAVPAVGGIAAVASAGIAQAAVASSIQVRGNQRIEASTIKAYLTIKPHKSYTGANIDASVKALYATGLFSDVGIAQRGSVLVVTVVENPVINSVSFEGNKKIKSDVLAQITDLKARGVLTDAKLKADIFHIKEYYRTRGRSDAKVEGRITKLSDNRVNVVFAISEGERTGVGKIVFVGNKAFSSYRLSGIITTKTTNWLSWLTKNDIYSEQRMNADADLLRAFYLKHGYADFQVLSQNASFDATTGKYTITFTLDEGPKYKYGTVNIDSSIHGIDTKALERFVKTRSGHTFDATQIQKTNEDLTVELSRLGYVFAEVRPRADRDYSNNTINLTYVIDEGPRVYIERIEIRGNTKTRDYVIRREFDVSEGDPYNRVLINKAERKLRNLDYFKTVSITTEPGSAPDKIIVVVNVIDKSTGSFGIAGGVETTAGSTGLVAQVSMKERNFLGRGQQVHISVGGGLNEQSINASFTDPYFLGNHMSFSVNGYRTYSTDSTARPFKTTATGGGVRLGLPITDNLTFDFGYKIDNIETHDYRNNTTVAQTFFPPGTRLSSLAGWGVTYSTIDNRLDPHEGLYFRFSQDFAGVGGDARFVRSTADARFYTPLFEDNSDMVGLLRVRAGNITGLGQPVSTVDNFFQGGETIRGFASLGYGPRYYDPSNGVNIALGGKNYINGTAEVQFPLPMVPPDFGLRGAVFADAGLLWGADVPSACTPGAAPPACDSNKILGDTAIRSSVGASIIWQSPFGPIRADFAEALSKKSYDTTQFFRLGTSAAF